MDYFSPTEIVGYLASVAVLASFVMKNMKTLRIVNTVACSIFIIYGIMLTYSIPIILTNGAIVIINLYYLLIKERRIKRSGASD
ncbi:MAG: YgjV family protein [Flavobacteriales bacterium]|nr:YgjV family protein [Flavobacteriales bacterium]